MNKIKKCPSCGSVKIKRVRQKWSGEYRGRSYIVENLEFHECPDCNERVYDPDAMRAIEANSPAFAKSVAT
ncbi:MAG: type II toxin-antitoxin system MqsA family antitoxin [Pirellulales bacterium]|nr:type II toxin-antitoxin system MqsA family antitoxin [Pirellulales bacterium]